MKVNRDIKEFNKPVSSVVTIGSFDGVHLGHQKILSRVVSLAKERSVESIVLTFWPHPRYVLNPGIEKPAVLTSIEEKSALLEQLGIDHLLIIPFTKELSEISPEDFVQEVLIKQLGTKLLVMGYDNKFGKNREGNFEFVQQNSSRFGIEVEEISMQDLDRIAISSTEIRVALASGKVKIASQFLGRPYSLEGIVVKGNQLGNTIGYPTANIRPSSEEKLLPTNGVYAVKVWLGKKVYGGMMNIGMRPTVNGKERTIEVNIFNFSEDIYEKAIKVEFIDFLREEKKFNGLEALKEQLLKDKEHSQQILSVYDQQSSS